MIRGNFQGQPRNGTFRVLQDGLARKHDEGGENRVYHKLPRRRHAMPLTSLWVPVLSQFLCVVEKTTGMPIPPTAPADVSSNTSNQHAVKSDDLTPKKLPKGVVLGPDGKP